MNTYQLQLDRPRPYFAEIPYYLWGHVNYDSEGDCKRPTDREWTSMQLEHRGTREVIDIHQVNGEWHVEGNAATVARLALFLSDRCGARSVEPLDSPGANWDHSAASVRASRVASEFEQPVLGPFDSHLFWGSWKWIGWFATEFTWVGRWIMHSIVRNDPRGVSLCIDWLKTPPSFPEQEVALSHALHTLCGEANRSGKDWVAWYEGGWFSKGAKARYPEPDFNAWLAEMKVEFGEESEPGVGAASQ
jgi:hypothetical protein